LSSQYETQYETSSGPTEHTTVHYGFDFEFPWSSFGVNYLLGTILVVLEGNNLDAFALIAHDNYYQVRCPSTPTVVVNRTCSSLQSKSRRFPVPESWSSTSLISPSLAGTYWIMAVYADSTSIGKSISLETTVKYQSLSFGSSLPTNFGPANTYTTKGFNYYLIAKVP
jgi:hypothetical protein